MLPHSLAVLGGGVVAFQQQNPQELPCICYLFLISPLHQQHAHVLRQVRLFASEFAATGYVATGPANEGKTGRFKSPYVRNCTNFMSGSVGMKIDGNSVNAALKFEVFITG